tara:strand:- start:1581 stop:2636 length:1056 start_codon:yes stop_codon:yes gene_type:complete
MYGQNSFTQIPQIFTTELPVGPGYVNNLGVKTIKRILNINSSFRDNYTTTSATNFTVKLPYPLNKVISMKLYDYHLPQDNYSISNYYNNNNFTIIRNSTSYLITIQDGMYTLSNISDLETAIKNGINTYITDLSDIKIDIDELTLKTTIYTDNSLNPFQLDFTYKTTQNNTDCNSAKINNITYKDQLTLGWILGYRGDYIVPIKSIENSVPQYPSTKMSSIHSKCMSTYTKNINDISFSYMDISGYNYKSEGLLNLTGERYMLLSIDDFQHNNNTVFLSPFKDQSQLNTNVLGKLTDNKQYSLNWPSRIYFGPTDIDKLGITIYDPFGRIYNNNYGDYSIELLVECIYDGK